MVFRAGELVAGYVIDTVLGAGGMGVVYTARHPRMQRLVALKVLNDTYAADLRARAAFDREAALAASLDHPNIVTVYDRSAPYDPALWLAMRHIPGGDASALLAREPGGLASEVAVELIADAAAALDYAHSLGVLHRDVKPGNLLLEHDFRRGHRALLTDFGIARTLDSTVTLSGFSASLAYAAPERFSDRPADHRADIYSLGCTLFHLLTGSHPFPRTDQAAVIGAHLSDAPPIPSRVRADLAQTLDEVITRALAKDPNDRYPTCGALADAARSALNPAATTSVVSTAPIITAAPEPQRDSVPAATARYDPTPQPVPATPLTIQHPDIAPSTSATTPPAHEPSQIDQPSSPILEAHAHDRRTARRRVILGAALAAPVAAATAGFMTLRSPSAPKNTTLTGVSDAVLNNFSEPVASVSLSPDGTLLAVAGTDTLRLWEVDTRHARPASPSRGIQSVSFNHDGTLLATGDNDGEVWLWNVVTGLRTGQFTGHTGSVRSVAFNHDSTALATAGDDSIVRLWTVAGRESVAELSGHDGVVLSVAFSPDGALLASAGSDETVRLWNVAGRYPSGEPLSRHSAVVWTVAFNHDGTLLAAGVGDSTVQLWDIPTRQFAGQLTGHTDSVRSVAFNHNSTLLATAASDSTVRLWNVAQRRPIDEPLNGHTGAVSSISLSQDGTRLASGSSDGTVRLWN